MRVCKLYIYDCFVTRGRRYWPLAEEWLAQGESVLTHKICLPFHQSFLLFFNLVRAFQAFLWKGMFSVCLINVQHVLSILELKHLLCLFIILLQRSIRKLFFFSSFSLMKMLNLNYNLILACRPNNFPMEYYLLHSCSVIMHI